MTAIEFNTREYRFSHGHEPRGRGSWAFFFDRAMRIEAAYWTPSCTYSEAKKMAKAECIRRFGAGCRGEIFVGS